MSVDPIPSDDVGQTRYAIEHGMVCPICKAGWQIWVTDGRWICHRVGCWGKGGFDQPVAPSDIETEILNFATEQWGEKNLAQIGLKLGEEAGEVCGAIVKLGEGRVTNEDLDDELGDALIVLSQLAARRHTTLHELRRKRFEHIKRRAAE